MANPTPATVALVQAAPSHVRKMHWALGVVVRYLRRQPDLPPEVQQAIALLSPDEDQEAA